jgi:DNA-damage-inducible protein J
MLARKQTSIKIDPEAWEEAKVIFKEYNLTVSDAVNIFLNKVRLEKGMPFDMKLPDKQDSAYLDELKNRQLPIDPSIDIITLTDEMNSGLS